MKEKFPNLAKEIDFQEVQDAQRIPKKLDPRRNTPRHIIITLPKIKQKERILEAAREKDTVKNVNNHNEHRSTHLLKDPLTLNKSNPTVCLKDRPKRK